MYMYHNNSIKISNLSTKDTSVSITDKLAISDVLNYPSLLLHAIKCEKLTLLTFNSHILCMTSYGSFIIDIGTTSNVSLRAGACDVYCSTALSIEATATANRT